MRRIDRRRLLRARTRETMSVASMDDFIHMRCWNVKRTPLYGRKVPILRGRTASQGRPMRMANNTDADRDGSDGKAVIGSHTSALQRLINLRDRCLASAPAAAMSSRPDLTSRSWDSTRQTRVVVISCARLRKLRRWIAPAEVVQVSARLSLSHPMARTVARRTSGPRRARSAAEPLEADVHSNFAGFA